MALFDKKENTEKKTTAKKPAVRKTAAKKETSTETAVAAVNAMSSNKHAGAVLLSPRVTEKGALLMESGAYVFNVDKKANKKEIATAINTIYKVMPRKVTIVRFPGKTQMTRGTNRMGRSASGKKAYVFLKKGETIDVM